MGKIADRQREFGDRIIERKVEEIEETHEVEKKQITPQTMMEEICAIHDKVDEALRRMENINKDVIDITNIVQKFKEIMEDLEGEEDEREKE